MGDNVIFMMCVSHMAATERDDTMHETILQEIVSAVILDKEKNILLLKRSPDKKDYPLQWDTVVGKMEYGYCKEDTRNTKN